MIKQTTIQEINTLYKKGSSKRYVFVLHGYGASCQDLVSIGDYLDPEQRFNWYFLDGIESLKYGGMEIGRAWFDTLMNDVLSAVAKDDFAAIDKIIRPQLQKPSRMVLQAISSLDLDPSDVCVAGFSQGAMVATEIVLQEHIADQLLVLSGAFAGPVHWREQMLKQSYVDRLSAFQSHGTKDEVLQFKVAKPLKSLFEQFNLREYEFCSFDGAHEIPEKVLSQAKQFIGRSWS